MFAEKNYDAVYSSVMEIARTADVSTRVKKFAELFANKISANVRDIHETTGGVSNENDGDTSNN